MKSGDQEEAIAQYLTRRMSEVERSAFEQKISESPQLAQKIKFEKLIAEGIKNYKKGWGNILLKRIESNILIRNQNSLSKIKGAFTFLRKDGLLEVYTSMDSTYVRQNIQKKVHDYKTSMKSNKFSTFRFLYLRKTIQLLKKHGEVYLVRIPVHTSLLKIENSFDPQFDKRMINLADSTDVKYLNYSNNSTEYFYTDGNHLYIKEAKKYSIRLAERIKHFQILTRDN